MATERAAAVAASMAENLTDMARSLNAELVRSIPELRGDEVILDLLLASTETNVETFLHVARYGMDAGDVDAPAAAVEYARRLAQRGISSNALLRAYRLGQRGTLAWLGEELQRTEPDGVVGLAALLQLQRSVFAYVDKVAEYVVSEYERERERWVANRNAVRAQALKEVLSGRSDDIAKAEAALGYRLRQAHLAAISWSDSAATSADPLLRLGTLLSAAARELGSTVQPLIIAQDDSTCWGWIPLGSRASEVDVDALETLVNSSHAGLRLALGTPAMSVEGFRISHEEAQSAYTVASAAKGHARTATSYGDPRVRSAAMLARDLPSASRLVRRALGNLAEDTEPARRLRETLQVFLEEKGSFVAAGKRLHVHQNTVKYRVEKALEERGAPLGDDRLELELALVASELLGRSVLVELAP